jgi:hypothetical protein
MITDDLHLAATAIVAAGREAGASSDVEDATAALVELAESLRTAGDACDALAAHVIPDAIAGSICDRYRAAADAWPGPSRPSYGQLAAILSNLHDTSAAIRLAGRRCDGAVDAVSATTGPCDATA